MARDLHVDIFQVIRLQGQRDQIDTRVHDAAYLERVASGALDAAEQRAIGFPWSERMVDSQTRSSTSKEHRMWTDRRNRRP